MLFENQSRNLEELSYIDSAITSNFDNWYVTSFRFELCGDTFATESFADPVNNESILLATRKIQCQPRLRLEIQPFNDFNPLATAIHILYPLEPSASKSMIDSLIAIKQLSRAELALETTGLPLTIHPALTMEIDQKKNGVAQLMKSTLLAAADPLDRSDKGEIVTLVVRASINHWKFVGGRIQDGLWTRFVTEFSKQFNDGKVVEALTGTEDLTCSIFSVCVMKPSVQPTILNPAGVSITEIFQNIPELQDIQTVGHRTEEILVKSEMIDSARVHFFNTNCVSCHQSSNLRDSEKLHLPFSYAEGVTPFVPKKFLNDQTINVINFGYWGANPRISNRTAFESAAVATALNKYLELPNPAPAVTDTSKLWICLTHEIDFKKCF